MQWKSRRGSGNIEDRRGSAGSGRGGIPAVGGVGLIAVVVIGWFFGIDLTPLLDQKPAPASQTGQTELSEADRQAGAFVSVTLADTEEVWSAVLPDQAGLRYAPPVLVLYSGVTGSPCGTASGATGPFYCPQDRKVYLDTAFFATMARDLGAGGDFAAAYVVAHEVAHHVQNELGILAQANARRAQVSEAESNAISVRIELQADCLAGVWAAHADARFGSIEPGDVDEAVNAAARIGDDTLARAAGRVPMPDSFSHGTSAQRARWLQRGMQAGRIDDCDTFSARKL